MLSILKESKITVAKAEVAAGSTDVADAAIIDMQGFESVAFLAVLGADNADTAKVELSAVMGNNNALSDGVENTTKASYTFTSATSGDHGVLLLDVIRPGRRYVRCKIGRATANTNVLALLAVRYNGAAIPSAIASSVIASATAR